MLEVEDWTQPSHTANKRRLSGKKNTLPLSTGSDALGLSEGANQNPARDGGAFFAPQQTLGPGKLSPAVLPHVPPEAEVEDTFEVMHPPGSHLFPGRARANSSPGEPRRPSSSLSRLLAQADGPRDNTNGVAANSGNQSAGALVEVVNDSPPATSPPPPPSPVLPMGSTSPQSVAVSAQFPQSQAQGIANPFPQTQGGGIPAPSPLRPGSRASRLSTTSRFSGGRLPPVLSAQPKAAPTTALSEHARAASASGVGALSPGIEGADSPFMSPTSQGQGTPSPEGSLTDALVGITSAAGAGITRRLRTTSQQGAVGPVRPSLATTTVALTSLASSWGMAFGRRKKAVEGSVGGLTPTTEGAAASTVADTPNGTGGGEGAINSNTARDLLRRF